MENKIVQKSEDFVRQLFKEKLSKDFLFHDLSHTRSVEYFSRLLGQQNDNCSPDDLEILAIAAWFHDTGYTQLYTGHEAASSRIAKDFLAKQNYPKEKIKAVEECIEATRTNYVPKNKLQEIIKDADLSNLGTDTFYDLSIKLRHEWDVLCNTQYTDIEWLENNLRFLNNHQYFTKAAKILWKEGKKKNLKKMKDYIKAVKKTGGKEKTDKEQ
ncbi:MAG: putative metal-dependent HD superfamily phosphohydrolase [Saprospiraceae bacterium]|jgi:predicted metal-dependent HD superfamily phosphohydrolase